MLPGGIIPKSKLISFKRNEVLGIEKIDLKDEATEYAYGFVSYENIEDLCKDDTRSFVRFRIYATDVLSSFCRVFRKDYHTKKNSVKEGDSAFGDSLKIR